MKKLSHDVSLELLQFAEPENAIGDGESPSIPALQNDGEPESDTQWPSLRTHISCKLLSLLCVL